MPYNNTENLQLDFSSKTHYVNKQFSNTGTKNGFSYRETLTIQLKVQVTKIFLNYTNSVVDLEIKASRTRVWLKLEHRIWFTETITTVTVEQASTKEIKKGNKNPLASQSLVAELILTLNNKDPPYLI